MTCLGQKTIVDEDDQQVGKGHKIKKAVWKMVPICKASNLETDPEIPDFLQYGIKVQFCFQYPNLWRQCTAPQV